MKTQAVAKYMRVQPRKVRLIAEELKGKPAAHSVDVLGFHKSKSAQVLRKVIKSAMANARETHGVDPENLRIARIMVDEGPSMKRLMARAMGRGNRILKKTSHITVIVEEFEPRGLVKPHGTKAKPRPTFKTGTVSTREESKGSGARLNSQEKSITQDRSVKEHASEDRLLTDVFEAPSKQLEASLVESGLRLVIGMKLGASEVKQESRDGVVVWADSSNDLILAGERKRGYIDVAFAIHQDSQAYIERRTSPTSESEEWKVFAWREEDGSVCTLKEHPENAYLVGHWRIRSFDEAALIEYLRPIAEDWQQSLKRLKSTVQGVLKSASM
jgi:large subunit ribosomal protein L22